MGIHELQQQWDTGFARGRVDEWQVERERDLPALRTILDKFLTGAITSSGFRDEMDDFSRETHYAGFHGYGGQMFLNLLARNATEES